MDLVLVYEIPSLDTKFDIVIIENYQNDMDIFESLRLVNRIYNYPSMIFTRIDRGVDFTCIGLHNVITKEELPEARIFNPSIKQIAYQYEEVLKQYNIETCSNHKFIASAFKHNNPEEFINDEIKSESPEYYERLCADMRNFISSHNLSFIPQPSSIYSPVYHNQDGGVLIRPSDNIKLMAASLTNDNIYANIGSSIRLDYRKKDKEFYLKEFNRDISWIESDEIHKLLAYNRYCCKIFKLANKPLKIYKKGFFFDSLV
jgi:hypothetical protein